MTEQVVPNQNPRYPKLIERPDLNSMTLNIGNWRDEPVEFTSDWYPVEGGKGVSGRNWKISRLNIDVDGADITIEAGGYTPIQLVKAANVVVDTPETGEAYCVVLDTNGRIFVNHFQDTKQHQMVWTEGIIITWIAKTSVRLTEFENPSYSQAMFETVPEDESIFEGRDISAYLDKVKGLRLLVASQLP